MDYNRLNDDTYRQYRLAFIAQVEGVKSLPYYDSASIPTIGIGFNLRVNEVLQQVVQAFGFDLNSAGDQNYYAQIQAALAGNAGSNAALQAQLNAIMQARATAEGGGRTTFAFSTGAAGLQEIQGAFALVVQAQENVVTNFYGAIPNSTERLALLSLKYSGVLGPALRAALNSGDRAEAWYEIQYASNLDGQHGKRRYEEAALFGLFDANGPVTLDGASDAYRMLALNRSSMISYDKRNGVLVGAANADLAATQIPGVAAQTAQVAFAPAAAEIIEQLAGQYGSLSALSPGFYNPLDIYLNPGRAAAVTNGAATVLDPAYAAKLDASGTSADVVLIASEGGTSSLDPDLGNDALIAGSGDDVLIAGKGNDTLTGGSGNDTIIAGAGNALVRVGTGNNLLDFEFGQNGAPGLAIEKVVDSYGSGSIIINGASIGGALSSDPSQKDVWTDLAGNTYRFFSSDSDRARNDAAGTGFGALTNFASYIGELVITPALGSASSAGAVELFGFNLQAAENNPQGFLGIVLPKKVSITVGSNAGFDPPPPGFEAGGSQSYTVWLDAPAAVAQIVTVTLSGVPADDFGLDMGTDIQALSAVGTFTITIPAGQASASFTLTNTGDTGDDSVSLQLIATVADPTNPNASSVSSDPLTQSYVEPATDNPFAQPTAPSLYLAGQGTTDDGLTYTVYTNTGSASEAVGGVGDGNNYIDVSGGANESIAGGSGNDTIDASFGQVTTGGALVDGGVDVITGNGGNDFILAGSPSQTMTSPEAHSDVRIYAGSEVDLSTAIENANSAEATGQQGDLIVSDVTNATIVGSNGNDLIIDAGNDVVVAGPGDETIVSGVYGVDDDLVTFGGWNVPVPNPGQTWSDTLEGAHQIFFSDNLYDYGVWNGTPPDGYEGNYDDFAAPFLSNNATIFGGSGNDLIELSNGNNEVELGTGDSTVYGGMGSDTVIGGGGDNEVVAGGGDDYITAGDGDSYLVGQAGDNTLIGGAGEDTLFAGGDDSTWATEETGDNYVEAGSGNALIFGSGGNDTLVGGTGNDTILAGDGNELIVGGSGDESIDGGAGDDTLAAGDGRDTIWAGTGDTTIYGGDGVDELHGGSGTNLIYAGDGGTADDPTYVAAGSGDTTIYGGDGVDYIVGGDGNDVIYAGDGGNAIAATTVIVGGGDTTVYGGNGITQIYGGSGTNVLYAGDGGTQSDANLLSAGTGTATLYGGAGYAILQDSVSGHDVLSAGTGNNDLYGIGDDTLIAGSGVDFLSGSGDNTYVLSSSGGEAEIANAGGSETLEFSSDVTPTDVVVSAALFSNGDTALVLDDGDTTVTIDGGLSDANVTSLVFGSQSMSVADLIQQASAAGNTFDETLTGDTGNLVFDSATGRALLGGGGHDTISAWGDHDTVTAGSGGTTIYVAGSNASVNGGAATDILEASGADSTLVGGLGNETFQVDNATTVVQAQYGAASNTMYSSVSYTLPENVDVLTLTGSADLVAYGNNDETNVITANSGNDTLYAGSWEDTLISGTGVDMLVGGTGDDVFIINNSNDQISFSSWHGNDTVYSSVSYTLTASVAYLTLTGSADLTATDDSGYVTLTGNAGNDTLIGGSGADTLVAGTGIDTLVTGTGNNTLVINNVHDVIEVSAGAGSDTVESSVSYTLQRSLDTLELTGSANVVGEGNDDQQNLIVGNNGNDTLIAGSGSDTLVAGTGIDTLIAGSGQDLLQGRGGDTFVLSGSGSAEIQVLPGSGAGTINFGAGVAAADLSMSLVTGSDRAPALLITGDGISATVDGGLQGSIGKFDFADGSQLSLAQLLSAGHVQSSSVALGNGSLILDGTPGDSLQGGTGDDTLIGVGAGDTIVAGSGNQALYGYGDGDLLVAGVGNDTIYGSGNDTLAGGTGSITLYGGPGRNTYLLTQGGSATLYNSSGATGPQVIFLPPGMTAADFTAQVSPNGDLILQSSSGDTLAVIRGFYSDANANTAWILADQTGNSQLLRDWVNTSSQGSPGGGGGSGVSAYEAEIQALLKEYQLTLGITLNEMGHAGTTMSNPNRPSSADDYNFTGVSTQSMTVQGGSLHVGASDSDQSQFVVTGESTYTESYAVPVYATYTIPSSITFVPVGDADLTNLEVNGESLDPITINGQTGFAYYNPAQTVTVQTGTRIATTTYTVENGYTTETQGFSVHNITGDGGSDVITAEAPFLGTVVTGDGNNISVQLDLNDDGYWNSVLWLGHFTYNAGQTTLAPGAFIDVGNGINDTIIGSGNVDVIAAGLGFDYILAGFGSTVYVPMVGASTDIITTTNSPFYGSGPFPKNTLVLPAGITPQDLQVKVIDNQNLAFDSGPDSASGSSTFLQLTYGDSTVLLEYAPGTSWYLQNATPDDSDGINLVRFADGTELTRSQLLAMAGDSFVEVDDTYNPVITQLAQSVVANTEISAATLFTASDASGSSIRLYQISNDPASGAYFSLNGTVYSAGQGFEVAADQLSQLQYIPGASGSTDTLTVRAWDGFAFGDASNLSLSVAAANTSVFEATNPNQAVVGSTSGPDTLIGGFDGDTLVGASGADTFEYSAGSGAETIEETVATTASSANVLQFDGGIIPADISLSIAAGGALVASIGGGGDSVTLAGFNPTDPLNSMPIQQFQFADATTLTFEQLLSQVAASSGEVTNPDGSITYYDFTPGQDQIYEGQTFAAGSQAGQQVVINADGTIQEYTLDGEGRRVSTETTFTDGSTADSTYSYNADGSYTQTQVNTPADAGATTTIVMHFDSAGNETDQQVTNPDGSIESDTFDAQGRWVERDVTRSDGSTDNSSFVYNSGGTITRTELETDAGGSTTTFVMNFNAQGQLTTQNETDPDGTTYDSSYSYNPDGSSVGTTLITPAGGGPITTQVSDYDSSGNRLSENSYTTEGGSYLDAWNKSDGSSGNYWWNASTLEYQANGYNSDGSHSTDDYQYAAGGSPGSSGVSFTETYSDSSGDQGTRQYDATTGVTTLSWYSDITGTLTGTTTDTGFVGLQNDGELTNPQHDPSFFNPAVSPSFQSFLAGH
jgi:Ca2+-binding RTX toxin-like protein